MKQIEVTFHLNDGGYQTFNIQDATMKEAYDFGQQRSREFNAGLQVVKVTHVSIKFAIEYDGEVNGSRIIMPN